MLYYLADYENFFGPLRLFRYLSFRCLMAFCFAAFIGFLIAPYAIDILHKIKFGQAFRTKEQVGKLAELHAAKKGTPTMGGIIIFFALVISAVLWAQLNTLVLVSLFVYVSFTILGFADDFLKIKRKSSEGVHGKVKLLVQLVVSLACVFVLVNSQYEGVVRDLYAPFIKGPIISNMPIWALCAFFFLVISGASNAINLTDGVDGLAIGCTISSTLAYGVFAYVAGNAIAANYLFLPAINGCGELCVVCAALVGASMAFLWHNAYPAAVFMGDTGSLALGGLIGTMAILTAQPLTLVIVGGVFVMETVSVMMQVSSYKLCGKRIFRCTPIHHHFEYGGWKETQVVIRFWIISLAFALMGIATLKFR